MQKIKIIILLTILFVSTQLKSQSLSSDSLFVIPKAEILINKDTLKIDTPFSKQNLIQYMEEIGIKYINFTLAQAIHESANFRSRRFIQDNNMFGMRKATQRKTTASGVRNKYATYTSWQRSVDDFLLMQKNILKKHKTKSAYMVYISRNYAADGSYMQKLKKYY
jgi:uncharacterized FlgJ-related protein